MEVRTRKPEIDKTILFFFGPTGTTVQHALFLKLRHLLTPSSVDGSLHLFLDDSFVHCDQCTNASSDQNTLPASVEGSVDASNVLEINETTECDVLPKDEEHQQPFHDVEGQWVEGIIEVGRVATSGSWLAGQVDEVRGQQWQDEGGESPESSWPPERTRQEQEKIRDLDCIFAVAEVLDGWDCERVAIWEDLLSEEVKLVCGDDGMNSGDCRQGLTRCLRGLDDSRIFVRFCDLRSDYGSSAINRVCDDSWRRWERNIRREGQVC